MQLLEAVYQNTFFLDVAFHNIATWSADSWKQQALVTHCVSLG